MVCGLEMYRFVFFPFKPEYSLKSENNLCKFWVFLLMLCALKPYPGICNIKPRHLFAIMADSKNVGSEGRSAASLSSGRNLISVVGVLRRLG